MSSTTNAAQTEQTHPTPEQLEAARQAEYNDLKINRLPLLRLQAEEAQLQRQIAENRIGELTAKLNLYSMSQAARKKPLDAAQEETPEESNNA